MMVRKKKTKKNSLNQYTVLWVSLVVLVLGIAVLYPFVKDGVVGQAYSGYFGAPCGGNNFNKGFTFDPTISPSGPSFCDAYGKYWTCQDENDMTVFSLLNGIPNQDGVSNSQLLCDLSVNKWIECNAQNDGAFLNSGDHYQISPKGNVYDDHFLCEKSLSKNSGGLFGDKYNDLWYICNYNGNIQAGAKKNTGQPVGDYTCTEDGWKLTDEYVEEQVASGEGVGSIDFCDSPGFAGTIAGQNYLCTSSTSAELCDQDGKVKTIITGEKGYDFGALCYNSQWHECNKEGGGKESSGTGVIPKSEGDKVDDFLCGNNEKWFACPSGSGSGDVLSQELLKTSEGEFICDDDAWNNCDTEGERSEDNEYLCFEDEWKVCNSEGTLSEDMKFYCDGDEWSKCGDDASEGDLSSDGNYYCYGEVWVDEGYSPESADWGTTSCDKANDWVTGNSLCFNQKEYECSANHDNSVVGFNKLCSNGNWVKCSAEDSSSTGLEVVGEGNYGSQNFCKIIFGYQWFNCPSSGVVDPFIHDDKSYICDNNAWKECTTPGEITANEDYICTDDVWTKCTSTQTAEGALCDGNNWVVCENEGDVMAGSGGSLFGMYVPGVPFYCDGTDWNICSGSTIGLMGNKYFCDGYNLDECNEDKVNQYSSDNNYICDGTQWLSIQQTGDLIAPSGYSWDYAPVSTLETPAAQCTNIPENYLGANPSNDLFCCPDASYCPKNDQTLGGDNCFAQNSVVKNSNSDFDLCGYGDEGAEWLKCAPGPLNLQGKVYNDEKFLCNQGWQSCDTEQVMGNNYCSGDKWITCNQSNAGMITPNDQWICNPTGWNSDFVFGSQELYELKIVEDKGGKNFAGVSNFRICEDANLPDLAEVCFNDVSKLPALKTVSKLNKDAEKPFVQNEITYLYESSAEPKTVSAIVTRDVNSLLLDLGNFAKNLNEGRRLMITLDGENYLLSREEGEGFYANLMLTHIPTMQKFPVEILPEGKFQFQVHAGKAIILSLKLLQAQSLIKFEEGVPELAQTAYALPDNLEEIYELPFSKEQPRKLQDFNDMLITVCNNDQSYDPEVLLVCKDNDHFLTLNKSEMTSTVLDYYEGTTNVGKEVGFLYQYVDGKKQGYIFNLQALSKDDSALNYSDFTEALVEGRRIALKFEDALYLLAQPEGDILSLPDMVLESYGGSEVVSTAAAGSTKEVSFLIAEGKITLHRDYATPPPPFQVSALTTLEVISTPVNMEEDLFTVMSSQVPVKLEGVNGLIKASETDFKQDADAFKIVYNNDNKLINLKSPVVFGNNLLYYDSAVIDGGNFIKTMKIYRLYDMDDNNHGEDFHVYDNQFIETFSSGKTLAIKFEDEYFVLGYIGSSESEEAFFSLDDLTLTNLEGSETYEKVVEDVDAGIKQAVFTTTLGKIAIKKDLTKSEIIFTLPEAILAEEDFNPLEDYSIVLKPGMKINVAGETISITETGISQTYINKVNVCGVDDDNDCIFIYKDEPLLLDEMSNQYDLLFWYDPIIEDDQLIEKQVKIYSVIDVSKYIPPTAENLDTAFTFENLFTENSLKEGKTPVLLWNDNYFELHSGLDNAVVDLSTYWLKAIPSGPETTLAMLSDTEGVNNASVYYENNLIFLQQVEKDGVDDIDLNLFSLPYELLTYEGINVTEDKVFTPSVHGNKYVIDAPEIITNLENTPVLLKIVIRNSEDEVVYQTLMPQGVTQEVLLPQGDFMSVGVLSVGLEEEDAVVVISS